MALGLGFVDIFPKDVHLTEEQKHQLEARCAIGCLLKKTADILGLSPPSFLLLPTTIRNGTEEIKKIAFIIHPDKASFFGLAPVIKGDDPWSIHAKIGSKISTFLESQGKTFFISKISKKRQ